MGNYNSNSPTLLGMEWRPSSIRQLALNSPGKGVLFRVKPGAITPAAIDIFMSKVVGSPGFGWEIYDVLGSGLAPPIDPCTDGTVGAFTTGSVTGWQNQTGAAATFAEVNDSLDTTYHRNTAATPIGAPIYDLMAGLNLGGPALGRPSYMGVRTRLANTSTVTAFCRHVLRIGGVNYFSTPFLVYGSPFFPFFNYESRWPYNPATGLPWNITDNTNFWNNVNEWGLEMQGAYASTIPATAFRIAESSLIQGFGLDHRSGVIYGTSGVGASGQWTEKAVKSPLDYTAAAVAIGANDWAWIHIFPWSRADSGNYSTIPVLQMPTGLVEATSPTSATGEHRKVYETTIDSSGIILTATPTVGEMIPALIQSTAPAIIATSAAYADLKTVAVFSGTPVNFGTEITSPGVANYGGIRLVLGWQTSGVQPDAPLTIELRHGAGFLTGGGTLDATVTINPTDLSSGALQDFLATFSASVASVAAQYCLRIFSTATSGKGWSIALADTRSDSIGANIVTADPQGASSGGATDGYFTAGVADFRYDVPALILAAPVGPASLTATPVAAA